MGHKEQYDSPEGVHSKIIFEFIVNGDTRHRANSLDEVIRIRDIWVAGGYKGTPRIIKIKQITETEELHV